MSKQIYLFATSKIDGITCIKSLEVRYLKPYIDFSAYDHLIITSKQIIKALEQYEKKDFLRLSALCVSQKTAQSFKDFGGEILAVGNGYGDNLLENIKEFKKETKWLYLRAEVIASNFVKNAKELGYNIDEEILYVSECSQELLDTRIDNDSTLIFTSPSAIECFLKNNTIHPHARIIVIGTTTAMSLPDDIKYEISEKTSLESCVDLALQTF